MRFTPHSFFKLGDELHFLLLLSMEKHDMNTHVFYKNAHVLNH